MKKIILTFLTITALFSNNIYAKEIQLTDYRYENIENGLYSYNYCNVNSEYSNSVILNPNGTELCSQDNKYIRIGANRGVSFPQYEKLFAYYAYNKDNENYILKIIDEKNNELYQFPLDDRQAILFLDNEVIILQSSLYSYLNDIPSIRNCSGVINLKNGVLITPEEESNTYNEPISWNTGFGMSENKEYFEFLGESHRPGTDIEQGNMYNSPFYHTQIFNADGIRMKGDSAKNINFEYIYYNYLEVDFENNCFISDKINASYISKTKQIGVKDYVALFKVLSADETEADYIPTESPSFWAEKSIKKATENGLLYNNSNCRYKDNITRQDFCILAVEAFCKSQGLEVDGYIKKNNISLNFEKFNDTGNAYILLANELGIVSGTSDETFSPYDSITRQQAAVMLSNIAKLAGLKENAPKVNFIDSQYYADWAKDAIYTVSSIKNDEGIAIMTGTEPDKFSPWMYYTREQAYVTIYRLFEMCK